MGDLPIGTLSIFQYYKRLPIRVEQNGSCPSDDEYLLVAPRWNDRTDINCLECNRNTKLCASSFVAGGRVKFFLLCSIDLQR